MKMALGFKAHFQNRKVRQTKNTLDQPISQANPPTNQTQTKKQAQKTDSHNFKDENGTWIQSIFSE
jgi:hypothetical protein